MPPKAHPNISTVRFPNVTRRPTPPPTGPIGHTPRIPLKPLPEKNKDAAAMPAAGEKAIREPVKDLDHEQIVALLDSFNDEAAHTEKNAARYRARGSLRPNGSEGGYPASGAGASMGGGDDEGDDEDDDQETEEEEEILDGFKSKEEAVNAQRGFVAVGVMDTLAEQIPNWEELLRPARNTLAVNYQYILSIAEENPSRFST